MPKTKTNSGAKKRLKVTGAGKLLRRRAMRKGVREKMSSRRKRDLDRTAPVHGHDDRSVRKLLGLK